MKNEDEKSIKEKNIEKLIALSLKLFFIQDSVEIF